MSSKKRLSWSQSKNLETKRWQWYGKKYSRWKLVAMWSAAPNQRSGWRSKPFVPDWHVSLCVSTIWRPGEGAARAASGKLCRWSETRDGCVRKWTLKSKSGKCQYDLVFRQHHPIIKDQADTSLIPFGTRGS